MTLTRWQIIRREFQREGTFWERVTFFVTLLIPRRWWKRGE